MNIFVGNLLFEATEADVRRAFEAFGNVASAVIVLEKKGTKSRGFGFVEMPDEAQARAAIAALDGKDFMGRPLNVSPAHPKPEPGEKRVIKKKIRPEGVSQPPPLPQKEGEQKKTWYQPVFQKTGGYKGGRRTASFMKKRAAAGVQVQDVPRRTSHENPLRWRKKRAQPKPWKKGQDAPQPWKKTGSDTRRFGGGKGESKPGIKKEGISKPWKKTEAALKPWRKKSGIPHQPRFKNRKKSAAPKKG